MGNTENSNNRIQVIERAVAILRALRDNPSGLSLGKISKQVSLPRSTVQRLVNALKTERMVISLDARGGWVLGPELQTMVQKSNWNIIDAVRPSLFELSQKTGETVDLSVYRGAGMIFLDTVSGNQRLAANVSVGDVFPLTTTANGMAALSLMTDSKVEKLAAREWEMSKRASDMNEFLYKIRRVRSSRFSYDLEEHTKGVCAIGIGFLDWRGDPHAISVPIPATRYSENKGRIETELLTLEKSIKHLVSLQ